MLSEQIRGIANHIIVGLLIDNKIIRLLYPIANEVEKLEDNLERIDGERVQFGDRVAYLECFNQSILTENRWMRREIERVGRALYTGTETGYVGTEEDLHAIGQFVEGVCENNERLFATREALDILVENASSISIQGKMRMVAIGLGAWKRAMDKLKDER